tara:strand:- start:145 stop:840 length:696 start_codon:yes stop_codon:yes gene_type:complete
VFQEQKLIPPYVPYRTFQTFLEFLFDEGIPDRIDRSVWGLRFSGSSGTQLMTTLKVLNLIDQDGKPKKSLEGLVYAEGEERKSILYSVLSNFYVPVFKLDLARASKGQFRDAFKSFGTKEGVIVKCEAFFIRAAQFAGIKLSKHILAGRHGKTRNKALVKKLSNDTQESSNKSVIHAKPLEDSNKEISYKFELASKILSKYPDYDPSWDSDVQIKWLDGMNKLYEILSNEE